MLDQWTAFLSTENHQGQNGAFLFFLVSMWKITTVQKNVVILLSIYRMYVLLFKPSVKICLIGLVAWIFSICFGILPHNENSFKFWKIPYNTTLWLLWLCEQSPLSQWVHSHLLLRSDNDHGINILIWLWEWGSLVKGNGRVDNMVILGMTVLSYRIWGLMLSNWQFRLITILMAKNSGNPWTQIGCGIITGSSSISFHHLAQVNTEDSLWKCIHLKYTENSTLLFSLIAVNTSLKSPLRFFADETLKMMTVTT